MENKGTASVSRRAVSGTATDYVIAATVTDGTNASEDTTAPGTGSLTEITVANQYVSTTGGSEDLHVQDADADIVDAGTDLVATPSGVEIDIDGVDRNAGGQVWDIGAHEGFEAAAAGGRKGPFSWPIHGPFGGPFA